MFELEITTTVTCVKCKRRRPMPEDGELRLHPEGSDVWVIDTQVQCGDGGLGCLETRVRVKVEFGFG